MQPNPTGDLPQSSFKKVRFRLPAQDDWEFLVLVELNNKSELSSGVSPRVKSSMDFKKLGFKERSYFRDAGSAVPIREPPFCSEWST